MAFRVYSFLIGFALTSSLQARYLPDAPLGECKRAWPGYTVFDPMGSESFSQFHSNSRRAQCYKEWLVIVYMAADNDLSPYAWRDLWEMEAVGSTASMDVVVFHDGADPGITYRYIARNPVFVDYEGRLKDSIAINHWGEYPEELQEEKFLAKEGKNLLVSPEVVSLPEASSADLQVAKEFLEWAFRELPSRRVLLIGWSHGEGFDAKLQNANQGRAGGFAFDEHCVGNRLCDEHMHVTQMSQAMRSLLARMRGGAPLDIIGSDACLNQQLEFAFEWRGVAEYLFGSSTIVQKKGFNYRTLLRYLADRPLAETAQIAGAIPKLYESSVHPKNHSRYSSYADDRATMATWTVSELERLGDALDDIGADLVEYLENSASATERVSKRKFLLDMMGVDAQTQVTAYGELLATPLRLGKVSMDLLNWLQAVGTWMRVAQDRAAYGSPAFEKWSSRIRHVNCARDLLNRSVLAHYVGPYYFEGLVKTSLGVAIWAPHSRMDFHTQYPKLLLGSFYQRSLKAIPGGWARFMDLLGRRD